MPPRADQELQSVVRCRTFLPGLQAGQCCPPQSMSVSPSFWTPSLHVGATHLPVVHTPEVQSAGPSWHIMPAPQASADRTAAADVRSRPVQRRRRSLPASMPRPPSRPRRCRSHGVPCRHARGAVLSDAREVRREIERGGLQAGGDAREHRAFPASAMRQAPMRGVVAEARRRALARLLLGDAGPVPPDDHLCCRACTHAAWRQVDRDTAQIDGTASAPPSRRSSSWSLSCVGRRARPSRAAAASSSPCCCCTPTADVDPRSRGARKPQEERCLGVPSWNRVSPQARRDVNWAAPKATSVPVGVGRLLIIPRPTPASGLAFRHRGGAR